MKFKTTLSAMFLFVVLTLTVNAAGSVSGLTNGGSLGKTSASGNLSISQGGLFSDDSATGSTQSDASGDLGVGVFVHYATSGDGDVISDSYNFETGYSVSTTATAGNDYGTYVNGGHTYSSTNYGSWSGGTNLSY